MFQLFARRSVKPLVSLRSRASTSVVDDLYERGFVAAVTSPNLKEAARKPISVYLGVDPSAQSLHAGNLLALLGLLHFHLKGHQVFALVGGATGSIGDPSGRSSERQSLSSETLEANVQSITHQVHSFLKRGQTYADKRPAASSGSAVGVIKPPKVVNNLDWFKELTLLDFLRTTGKEARVQHMLAKDSVRNRLDSESGISFTEFTYQLLQARDFLHLHKTHQVNLQLGGSDQWGNIVSGLDLIHKHHSSQLLPGQKQKENEHAWGLTMTLLTTSSGQKFGKSVGNPVWLDDRLTSVFDFYQFFLRVTDLDVERYLKLFTLLPLDEIDRLVSLHNTRPEDRRAQRSLASEVTELVHGQEGLERALTITQVLFGTDLSSLTTEQVNNAFDGDSRLKMVPRTSLPISITALAVEQAISPSRRTAGKLMSSGAFYLNGKKVTEPKAELTVNELIDGRLAVLKFGKTGNFVVRVDDV